MGPLTQTLDTLLDLRAGTLHLQLQTSQFAAPC